MPDESARKRGRAAQKGSRPVAPTPGWIGTPSVAAFHVRRPRLLRRLEAADERQLVLVSAPAGYGKTSLVADWISSCGADDKTAWVTFEDRDEGFWQGLVGCLESLGVETSAEKFSHTGPRVDPQILTSLASRVAGQGSRLRVVIDGHDVVSAAVGRDLDFLLRHSGHRLQVVLLTRSDPLLPLYRYRLDATIAELRMSDLAFTDDEASELFASVGVELQTTSVQALNARAHGWAVGLRFASAVLLERADTDAAVAEVVGDTGNIAEYLVAEVLDVQTPEVRQLLLSTSIIDMVRPGLDAALGGSSAARNLSLLTRENVFVEPVPGSPGCYRYHPFFRELLRATLSFESPQELERLHRVAAEWYAEQGEIEESVGQLAAIPAWDEAAGRVVVDHGLGELLLHGSSGVLRTRLRDMPPATVGPAAPLVRAALSLVQGETAQSGRDLARARKTIDPARGDLDADAEVALAVLDALRARNDDAEAASERSDRAATALTSAAGVRTDPDPLLVGLVSTSKGIAAIRAGDLAVAGDDLTEAASAASPPEPLLTAEAEGFLALLACFRGRLSHASELASHALVAAEQLALPAEERPSAASLAMAWVAVERCDLPAAIGHAAQAERSHFLGGDPVTRAVLALIRSRIEVARGHLAGALSIVQAATALAPPDEWLRRCPAPRGGAGRACPGGARPGRGAPDALVRAGGGRDAAAGGPARPDPWRRPGRRRHICRAPGLAGAPRPGQRAPGTGVGTTPERVAGPRQGSGGPCPAAGSGGAPPPAVPRGCPRCPRDAEGRCGSAGSPSVAGAGPTVTRGGPLERWSAEARPSRRGPRAGRADPQGA